MDVDPIAMIQASRATLPLIEGARMVDGPVFNDNGRPNLHSLPQGPGSPGYLSRIPPGEKIAGDEEPDPADQELDSIIKEMAQMAEAPVAPKGMRIAVMFGRKEGTYAVAVESPPDWDVEESAIVSEQALVEFLPVLRALGRIKDTTAGELRFAEEAYREKSARPQSPAGKGKNLQANGRRQPTPEATGPDGDVPTV